MNKLVMWICAVLLFGFCIQGISGAFTASTITIDLPRDTITAGTTVTASATVEIVGEFAGGELDLITDLDKTQWEYTILKDDVPNPRPAHAGRSLVITDFEIKYKKEKVKLKVTLNGAVPSVTPTGDKTMLKILEKDTNGHVVTSTQVIKTKTVINPGDKDALIQDVRAVLQALRSNIDEKAAIEDLDIDISAAEAKYNEAKSKIEAAGAMAVTQLAAIKTNVDTALKKT